MYHHNIEIFEKMIINPQEYAGGYRDEKSAEETRRISGTYLHGKLQSDNEFDIFGIVGEAPKYAGIYPCDVLGIDENCTFYFWIGVDNRPHGLVVANSDIDAVMYAEKEFNKKSSIL